MEAATPVPAASPPEQLLDRVQELQERLEATGDGVTREVAEELVSAVVQMYGAGLERIVAGLMGSEAGEGVARELIEDQFLSTLLLIHDLHPVALEDRVQAALDSVRPYMESHGGSVELLGVVAGVARIHLRGSCSDCSASAVTLELAIKQALEQAAPDLEGLEVEGMSSPGSDGGLPMATQSGASTDLPVAAVPPSSGMELPMVTVAAGAAQAPPAPSWFAVELGGELADGSLATAAVAGQPLVIANVEGTLLAYRDACAGCGGSLREAKLDAGALHCQHCRRAFFLPRAGRSLDADGLQLQPIPLLREADRIRVALAA